MESGERAGPVWAHNLTWTCKLVCMHTMCLHAQANISAKLGFQIGLACSPDSIYILISLIWPHLSEIWACARKHITCMHASLHAQVKLCGQTGPACSPDDIDTLIFLIWSNLAEIGAPAHQKIVCMHVCMPMPSHQSHDWHVPTIPYISLSLQFDPIWPGY